MIKHRLLNEVSVVVDDLSVADQTSIGSAFSLVLIVLLVALGVGAIIYLIRRLKGGKR